MIVTFRAALADSVRQAVKNYIPHHAGDHVLPLKTSIRIIA